MASPLGTGPLGGLAWIVFAALVAAPGSLCAQLPVNPLRPASPMPTFTEPISTESETDIWAEPAQSQVQLAAAEEALPPPEPRSLVPLSLGEPIGGYPVPSPDTSYAATPPGGPPWPAGGPMQDAPHDSWVQPWFTHTDPNDPYRHVGMGRPLVGTSWLNRPWYFGAFLGGLLADDLIAGHVESNNSHFIGGRLGWDFDHYWGLEGRYAFSRPQLTDALGDNLSSPSRDYFVDVSLAYYPWGDSQWRPFASVGMGFQTFRFRDDQDRSVHQSLLSVPLGVGLKFYHSPLLSLRLDAYDNIAFGDGKLRTMQNFSLAAGVEFRFGGRPTSYFPWHGSTSYR
ncbi:MAG: porin family protein [Pirellulaceae bacterium]